MSSEVLTVKENTPLQLELVQATTYATGVAIHVYRKPDQAFEVGAAQRADEASADDRRRRI